MKSFRVSLFSAKGEPLLFLGTARVNHQCVRLHSRFGHGPTQSPHHTVISPCFVGRPWRRVALCDLSEGPDVILTYVALTYYCANVILCHASPLTYTLDLLGLYLSVPVL